MQFLIVLMALKVWLMACQRQTASATLHSVLNSFHLRNFFGENVCF